MSDNQQQLSDMLFECSCSMDFAIAILQSIKPRTKTIRYTISTLRKQHHDAAKLQHALNPHRYSMPKD